VLGSQCPNRTASFSAILADSIARHGWGERLEIVCVGFGAGAGEIDRSQLEAAGVSIWPRPQAACPDLEAEIDRVEESDVLVVTTGEDAEMCLAWPEADGKQIFALSDFVGDEGRAVGDASAPLHDYVGEIREAVPLLLRALIAAPR
jgi:hypothetical protein